MASQRTILGAAAFSLALAAGGVAGAVLGTPGTSGAQDGTSTTDTTAPGTPAPDGWGAGHRKGAGLETAASALGMTAADLKTELESGKSIAEVAKEQGVDEQVVIDALVKEATTKLEEAIDNLPDRMTDLVERQGLPDRGPKGHPMMRHLELDTAAGAIGISTDDLRTALQGGQTIAEVATAHDVDPQKVIDAMVAKSDAVIDTAVKAGKVDADRAADAKANAKEHITSFVNEGPRMGHGGPGGFGGQPPADAPAGASTTS
jgi:hypothetical protein